MAAIVALNAGNRPVTAVGLVRINLEDHLTAADGIRFEVPDGTAIANGEQITVSVLDGTTVRRFGPFTVNTVRTNEPEVTATQSRDDTVDASILNDIVNVKILAATETAVDGEVAANADRQAFLAPSDYTTGYTVAEVVGNDIKSRQNLADAVKAVRGQLFEVVRTSTGYTLRKVEDALVIRNQEVVDGGAATRVIDSSELLGTIRGQGKWTALQGNITTDSVEAALERIRATYRTPNDDRERSTPALDNARALPGNYTSLVLAADALARHILLDRVDGTTIDVQLRLDMSIVQAQLVIYDSQTWQVVKLQHTLGPDVTDLTLKRVDLITPESIRTTYRAVREYMLPDRPTELAQGVKEGNVTQAVWATPTRTFSNGEVRHVDNIDGYALRRYINEAPTAQNSGRSTRYGIWARPDNETELRTTSEEGYTNSERHAVPGRNAHVLLAAPAGRRFPLEIRTYNELGTSRVGELANTTPAQEQVALRALPERVGDRFGGDAVLVLETVNGFPILPTRSTVWGYTEYAHAYADDTLGSIDANRVFDKRDFEFFGIDAKDKSKQLIVTPQTGYTIRGGGLIVPITSIGLLGTTGFIGSYSTITCSTLCVPAVQSFLYGVEIGGYARSLPSAAQVAQLAQARGVSIAAETARLQQHVAYIIAREAGGLELAGASRIALNLGTRATPGIATAIFAGLRVANIFSGPFGWAINVATLPAGFIISDLQDKTGNLSQFLVDPVGWVFERVEFQWQWYNNSDVVIDRAGNAVTIVDDDSGWNDFPFTTAQGNRAGGAGQGSIYTLFEPASGLRQARQASEMDWLNEGIQPSGAQLQEIANHENVGRSPGDRLTTTQDQEYLSTLFRVRQTVQTFNHKYLPIEDSRWTGNSRPINVRYRIRIVVDSQPDESKGNVEWDEVDGSGNYAREAITRKQALARDWLQSDEETVKPANYGDCRYRASEWHTTDLIPYRRAFLRGGETESPLE